jgi:two-component system sensor kinase FixL
MTARHRATVGESQRSLQLNEARWQAVLDSAQDAILSIDETGRITLFNRSAESMFGYAAHEVLGRSVAVLMPLPYRNEHEEYLRHYVETGIAKVIGQVREVQARRKNGEIFPVELSVSEARVENTVVYTGIVRDVTERKCTEEALLRERDFAERLLETAQVIVLVLDTEGRIVRFNAYMEEISGYRLHEVQGRDWFTTFLPIRDRERIAALFSQVSNGLQVRGAINPIVTKDGSEREIEWHAKTLTNTAGAVVGVLSIGQDITERIRAEGELREMQKRSQQRERLADIGAITAKIVHDLGNPLAGLSMQAQLILRRIRRDGGQALSTALKPAEQILAEVQRLESLINEFRDFSREQRLAPGPIHVPRFLNDVVGLWAPVAAAHGITLSLQMPESVPALRGDEEKLRRVLDNLLKNAVEAIDQGPGAVRVQVTLPSPAKLRISIADSGPGIPQTVEVFRLFETTKVHGSGLGLAIAKEIVLAHGGGIEFARVHPHGTVFHIELPCQAEAV